MSACDLQCEDAHLLALEGPKHPLVKERAGTKPKAVFGACTARQGNNKEGTWVCMAFKVLSGRGPGRLHEYIATFSDAIPRDGGDVS